MSGWTTERLAELGRRNVNTVKGYLKSTEGWKTLKKIGDIHVEVKPSECPGFEKGFLYRGEDTYPCPKETVFKYMDPRFGGMKKERGKWDKNVKDAIVLKKIDDEVVLLQTISNSAMMGIIKARDSVDVVACIKDEDSVSLNSISFESKDYPPTSDCIRAWNYPCGFYCIDVPGKPGWTRMVAFVQSETGGWLPHALVNAGIPVSMVAMFNSVREALEKDGLLTS